jgi:aspartyl-tRNA(Asn)/glutamyl-tRNA(Gln) amidotransferase subunit C
MSTPIDIELVRKVAHLARLAVTEDEVAAFSRELGDILAYVEQLSEVDTDGVEPLAHPLAQVDITRPDEPHQSLSNDDALAEAPARQGQYFKVPAVLDGGGAA